MEASARRRSNLQRRLAGAPALIAAFVIGAMFAALIAQADDDDSDAGALRAGTDAADPRAGLEGTGATDAPGVSGGDADQSDAGQVGGTDVGGLTPSGTPGGSGTGPAGDTRAAPPGGNGGATAPGVTADAVTVGILAGSSEALRPVCPRCGQGGVQTDRDLAAGLLKTWKAQGKLPIYGRDVKFVIAEAQDLAAETARAACREIAGQKPFAAVTAPGTEPASFECLAGEFQIPTIDGVSTTDEMLKQYPLYFTLGASVRQEYSNAAIWAEANGLLKGEVLGLYSPADTSTSNNQQYIDLFRQALAQRGYKFAADYQYQGTGQSDDAIAVQQMQSRGVTVMFVVGTFTEPSGFQNAAARVGYRPKYPIIDTSFAFNDAVADVGYNAEEQHGNIGMALHWWDWTARRPATPKDNAAAAECLRSYSEHTKTVLDVYDDTAKISYVLEICSDLNVLLEGVRRAGPKLTPSTFVAGVESIRNFETGVYKQVSFGPGRHAGLDVYTTAKFDKARWQPEHMYWRNISPWVPWAR